ncbi:MAG: DUF3604 domain-containing protein [Chlamydiae bacterium]|nr:DUF3604 domain-containing protein [Chlamydiota bacterium]
MRRSICYVEPKSTCAGKVSTFKFVYSPSNNLHKGTRLKFDLLSRGRAIDWQIPQTNTKVKDNLIWMQLPQGTVVAAKALQGKSKVCPQFEFVLPSEVKAGEEITILLGSPEPKAQGSTPQVYVQRRRPFHLYIDTKGSGDYKEPEVFTLDVKGNELKNIRIITPSMVSKNERFDVIVRFEDCHGNLTANAPEGTLIDFSYDQLRENLNWKLFVPETGFINLPNLYFNEPGIYRIKLVNSHSKEAFYSSPIKCIESDSSASIYWGVFHGEFERFDAAAQIESCLRYCRDDLAYHFFASSAFDTEEETSNETWKMISLQIAEFNEEDRFVTYLGSQYEDSEEGLRQLVFSKDNKPLLRKKDAKSTSLKKIYKSHSPKELIGIPSFTMSKKTVYDFTDFSSEYEPVVEIYNAWGSSECTKEEGNLKPITAHGKSGTEEDPKGSIRRALNLGHRFGFVAGGLDDRGVFASFYPSDQVQYTPGLTAVISSSQSRDGIFQALKDRRCYATTGARMIINLEIAGLPMGCILSTKTKPGLIYNRYIRGYVIGTTPLKKIEIFRNGVAVKTFTPSSDRIEFEFDESTPLEESTLKSSLDDSLFTYYYLRALQEDGHIAWGSPIWIEFFQADANQPPAKKPAKKPLKS